MRASPGLAMAVAMLVAAPARAETAVPTQAGETGYLHVPVAESQGRGGAAFSLDLRYSQAADVSRTVTPSPLVMSFGLGRGEAGFSLRQGGLPGDARPYNTIPAAAGKFSLLEAVGRRPALAVNLFSTTSTAPRPSTCAPSPRAHATGACVPPPSAEV